MSFREYLNQLSAKSSILGVPMQVYKSNMFVKKTGSDVMIIIRTIDLVWYKIENFNIAYSNFYLEPEDGLHYKGKYLYYCDGTELKFIYKVNFEADTLVIREDDYYIYIRENYNDIFRAKIDKKTGSLEYCEIKDTKFKSSEDSCKGCNYLRRYYDIMTDEAYFFCCKDKDNITLSSKCNLSNDNFKCKETKIKESCAGCNHLKMYGEFEIGRVNIFCGKCDKLFYYGEINDFLKAIDFFRTDECIENNYKEIEQYE